jgi:hypothetical protein
VGGAETHGKDILTPFKERYARGQRYKGGGRDKLIQGGVLMG